MTNILLLLYLLCTRPEQVDREFPQFVNKFIGSNEACLTLFWLFWPSAAVCRAPPPPPSTPMGGPARGLYAESVCPRFLLDFCLFLCAYLVVGCWSKTLLGGNQCLRFQRKHFAKALLVTWCFRYDAVISVCAHSCRLDNYWGQVCSSNAGSETARRTEKTPGRETARRAAQTEGSRWVGK